MDIDTLKEMFHSSYPGSRNLAVLLSSQSEMTVEEQRNILNFYLDNMSIINGLDIDDQEGIIEGILKLSHNILDKGKNTSQRIIKISKDDRS